MPNLRSVRKYGTEGGVFYGFYTVITELGRALDGIGIHDDYASPIRLSIPFYDVGEAHAFQTQETWCYTMFEFPEVAPDMVEHCNQHDFVIVPSEEQVDWFRDSGVDKPIFCCPLGVDEEFVYQDRHYSPLSLEPFRFLWLGAFTWRKNFQHAILAFKRAFYNRDDVQLYIKTSKRAYDMAEYKLGDFGNIYVDKRRLDRRELLDLYYTAHCFIHTGSVEGFALPPAEAMATGALVFAPEWGPMGTYVNDRTAIVMETEPHKMIVSMNTEVDPALQKKALTESWMGTTVRPDMDALVIKLRWIVDKYRETAYIRKCGAQQMAEQFRWRHTAERLATLIKQHSRRLNDVSTKDDILQKRSTGFDIRCSVPGTTIRGRCEAW